MYKETLQFERVFDVHQRQMNTLPHTLFGFEHEGKPQYGAVVPGLPTVEAGNCVTVLFKEKGNWQKVAGWANHTTGELTYESPAYWFFIFSFSASADVFLYTQQVHQHTGMALMMGAFAAAACFSVVRGYRCISIKRRLRALLTCNSTETPRGAHQ